MRFDQPIIPATLIRRRKRFLADVRLDNNIEITAHCPNSGSMRGCSTPGSRVYLSTSDNPRRKFAQTLTTRRLPIIFSSLQSKQTTP